MGVVPAKENWASGGPIRDFRGGWAKVLFGPSGLTRSQRVHWWDAVSESEGMAFYSSACGLLRAATDGVPVLAGGSWPRCKNCLKATRQK
jgi:hypothetical protein